MFYVLAAYYARGRFLSAVRQSAPSGTSHRGFETPGLRLLVTGSIHYTIKIASAAHGGGANPRPFTRKDRTKYRPGLFTRLPPSFPRTPTSFPRRREPREKQSTPFTIPSFPRSLPRTPIRGRALQRAERPSRGVGQTGTRRLFGLVTTTSNCAKVPSREMGDGLHSGPISENIGVKSGFKRVVVH